MGLLKSLIGQRLSEPPEPWFRDVFGGGMTKSSVTVDEQGALKFSAVFACQRVLAETLASVPVIIFRDKQPGNKSSGKDRVPDFHLYDVLKVATNDYMPAFNWKETMMHHITGSGNAYSFIRRNRRGEVKGLDLLPWTAVDVIKDEETGAIAYRTNDRGKAVDLHFSDVFHIPGLGFDGIKGYSPVRMAMEAIGLGLAAEEFGGQFFNNGANVGGVVEYEGRMKEESKDTFRKAFQEKYAGLGKSGSVLFLENGSKFTRLSMPNDEAQFLETRRFQIEEIARIYRVPMHLIQDLQRSTNNNIEHQSLEFIMYTMLPWFTRWEQMINFKLLTKRERQQGYFAEFLMLTLLRGDSKARAEMLSTMRQNGVLNADEWRELENMNPIEGDKGKTYFVNGNMVPIDRAGR